jgi:antibiotic biosynthesis monooxygenase (ABM) superfamily enzyme
MQPAPTPRRWKSMAATFAVVFPTVELLNRGILPLLGTVHFLLRDVLMVGSMCVALSYVLPWAMQVCRSWLSR